MKSTWKRCVIYVFGPKERVAFNSKQKLLKLYPKDKKMRSKLEAHLTKFRPVTVFWWLLGAPTGFSH